MTTTKPIPIFDGHNDTLLDLHLAKKENARSFFKQSDQGHIDLPRARKGGFGGGFFAMFSTTPNEVDDDDDDVTKTLESSMPPAIDQPYAQQYVMALAARLFRLEAEAVPENPIEYNIDSLKRGRILYNNHCALCHAEDGSGFTDYLEFLPMPPADLTTGVFRYGSRDGDLFTIIRDGTENGMEAFNDKLPDDDIWHTVNYIRRFSR